MTSDGTFLAAAFGRQSRPAGIGWYDGSAKYHIIVIENNATTTYTYVGKWPNATGSPTVDGTSIDHGTQFGTLEIRDDGTNVYFRHCRSNSPTPTLIYSVARASGYLGSSGYSTVVLTVHNASSTTIAGTCLSWTRRAE